ALTSHALALDSTVRKDVPLNGTVIDVQMGAIINKGGIDAKYHPHCAKSCMCRNRREHRDRCNRRNAEAWRRSAPRHRRRTNELRLSFCGNVVRTAGACAALFDAAEVRQQRLFENHRGS